ncbi:protein FAM189B [Carcharodon carcharias]|uniref:protein FAM189B n=1 Tax=Carcharodon carcharias TaxID=13397 RepID=UPI001B7E1E46|nr:protein FAM189B [Carcharodon carcharias]
MGGRGMQDLLFSVCGLSILSTIICTLSTVICCIQMFTVDVLHILVPQRSRSMNPECNSPHDNFLRHMSDPDEFVPPVPPPPYYPPEYTCSSETDAQSITYNGSMDSPVPLYPTDFPPPYEAVIGNSTASQVTDFDHQLTEISNSSFCEQILSTAFSGEGSMDSGSLMMSEIIDIPDDSSCSEDSCLMGVQGSVDHIRSRSSMQRGAETCGPSLEAEQYPANLRACVRSGRSFSCSASNRYCSKQVTGEDILTQSCQRLEATTSCSQTQAQEDWLSRQRNCSDSSDTSAFQMLPDNSSQGSQQQRPSRRYSESSRPQSPLRSLAACPLTRSNSDPALCVTSDTVPGEGNRTSKTSECERSQTSTDTAPCSEACLLPSSRHGTPELLRRMPLGKLRPAMKGKALQTLSKEGTRSLGDLKMCRGTRVLVARFLQRSKRNLTVEPTHSLAGAAGNKQRTDRGSGGSSFEQVARSQLQSSMRQRVSREEGIHLRSCGDLSSSTFSLRRLFSTSRLESSRPHSLIGVYRETVL